MIIQTLSIFFRDHVENEDFVLNFIDYKINWQVFLWNFSWREDFAIYKKDTTMHIFYFFCSKKTFFTWFSKHVYYLFTCLSPLFTLILLWTNFFAYSSVHKPLISHTLYFSLCSINKLLHFPLLFPHLCHFNKFIQLSLHLSLFSVCKTFSSTLSSHPLLFRMIKARSMTFLTPS